MAGAKARCECSPFQGPEGPCSLRIKTAQVSDVESEPSASRSILTDAETFFIAGYGCGAGGCGWRVCVGQGRGCAAVSALLCRSGRGFFDGDLGAGDAAGESQAGCEGGSGAGDAGLL